MDTYDWLIGLVCFIVALPSIGIEINVNAHVYCSPSAHSTWPPCFQALAAPPSRLTA